MGWLLHSNYHTMLVDVNYFGGDQEFTHQIFGWCYVSCSKYFPTHSGVWEQLCLTFVDELVIVFGLINFKKKVCHTEGPLSATNCYLLSNNTQWTWLLFTTWVGFHAFIFLALTNVTGLTMVGVLFCISLLISETKHLFICVLFICTAFSGNLVLLSTFKISLLTFRFCLL